MSPSASGSFRSKMGGIRVQPYDDFFMAFSALIVVMQTILAVLVFARKVNDGSICATRVACEERALLS